MSTSRMKDLQAQAAPVLLAVVAWFAVDAVQTRDAATSSVGQEVREILDLKLAPLETRIGALDATIELMAATDRAERTNWLRDLEAKGRRLQALETEQRLQATRLERIGSMLREMRGPRDPVE